jgi:hypothetical protein
MAFVEAARRQVGRNASIDELRVVLIKPQVQFLLLLGLSAPIARSISWTVLKLMGLFIIVVGMTTT